MLFHIDMLGHDLEYVWALNLDAHRTFQYTQRDIAVTRGNEMRGAPPLIQNGIYHGIHPRDVRGGTFTSSPTSTRRPQDGNAPPGPRSSGR